MQHLNNSRFIALITAILFSANNIAPAQTVAPNSLVGHWKFDEGSGITAADASGYGNNGTLKPAGNLPTWTTAADAKVGISALFFDLDGAQEYVEIPDNNTLEFTGAFTIAVWVNPLASGDRQVVSKFGSVGNFAYEFGFSPNTNLANNPNNDANIRLSYSANGSDYDATASTGNEIPVGTNTWTHIAVTYNTGIVKLFVNGVQISSAISPVTSIFPSGNTNLAIGTKGTLSGQYFEGSIDDVRLYNYALSTSEINAISSGATVCTITADAGPDTTIFAGDSVQIGSAPVAGNTYSWSPAAGLSDANSAEQVASPAVTTAYKLTITDTTGCVASDSITITVLPQLAKLKLGSAADFALLSAGNITAVDTTIALGNAGATGTISNNVLASDTLFSSNDIRVQEALADLAVANQIADTLVKKALSQNIGGLFLNQGAYSVSGAGAINSILTLKGDSASKFLFYFTGSFTAKSGSMVKLDGVSPENVFWIAQGNVLIEESSVIQGVVIGKSGIETRSNNILKLALFSLGNILIKKDNPLLPNFFVAPDNQTFSQHLGAFSLEIHTNDIKACDSAEFKIIFNTGDFDISGLRINVNLPAGINFAPGSATTNLAYISVDDTSFSPQNPIFYVNNFQTITLPYSFNPIPKDTVHTISFFASAGCSTGNSDSLHAIAYIVEEGGGIITVIISDTSNSFQMLSPNLTISQQDALNWPNKLVNIKDEFCREIKVINSGIAPLTQGFTIIESYGIAIEIDSVNIGTIDTSSNTVVFYIPPDSLPQGGLKPGGVFTITECIRVVECTQNDTATDLGKSDFIYYWGCPGDTCQYDAVSANVVIPKTNRPNIGTSLTFADTSVCYGPDHSSLTKVTLSNSGTGPAFDLSYHLYADSAYMGILGAVSDSADFLLITTQGDTVAIAPDSFIFETQSLAPTPLCRDSFFSYLSFCNLGDIPAGKSIAILLKTVTCCPGNGCGFTRTLRDSLSYIIPCIDSLVRRNYSAFYTNTAGWSHKKANAPGFNPIQKYDWISCVFVEDFAADSTLPVMPKWVLDTLNSEAELGDIAKYKFKATNFLGRWNGDSTQKLKVELSNNGGLCYIDSSLLFLVSKSPSAAPDTLFPDSVFINYTCQGFPSNCAGTVTAYFSIDTLTSEELRYSEFQIGYVVQCGGACPNPPITTVDLDVAYIPSLNCNSVCEMPVVCGLSSSAFAKTFVMCPGCDRSGLERPYFAAQRLNYGLPDNNNNGIADVNTGAPDTNKVTSNLVMTGDTLQCMMWGGIKNYGNPDMPIVDTVTGDSLYFKYGYYEFLFFDSPCDNALTLLDSIKGRIYDATINTTFSFTIPKNLVADTTIGGAHKYIFDFSIDMLHALGVPATYKKFGFGDSIYLTPHFKVTGNIGADEIPCFIQNFAYVAYTSFPSLTCVYEGRCSQSADSCGTLVALGSFNNECGNPVAVECDTTMKYFCEKSAGEFFLAGYTFQTTNSPTSTQVNSCVQAFIVGNFFRMGIPTAPTQFAFEYRNWGFLDSVMLVLPPGFVYDSAKIFQSRNAPDTAGGIIQQNVLTDTLSSQGDTLYFSFGSFFTSDTAFAFQNDSNKIYFSDDNQSINLTVYAHPTCATPDAVNPLPDQLVSLPVSLHFDPAFDPDAGANFSPQTSHRAMYVRPDLSSQGGPLVVDAISSSVCWKVLLENNSTGNASNVWLAADSGNITVTNIVVDNDTLSEVPGTVGIFPVGDINGLSKKTVKICTDYKCVTGDTSDMLFVKFGWECPEYPDSLESYACPMEIDSIALELKYRKSKLNQLVSVPDTIQLCDSLPVEILISSTDAANWRDVIISVVLPAGFTYDTMGIPLTYYPHNSVDSLPDPPIVSGNTLTWNLSDIDTFFTQYGLPGSGFVLNKDSTKVKIKFNIFSNCNVSKNNVLTVSARGVNNCGDTVVSLVTTKNIIIGNFPVATKKDFLFDVSDFNACDSTATVTVTLVNTDTVPTDSMDIINFYLAPFDSLCVFYVDSSTNFLMGDTVGEPVKTGDVLTWQVPPGLVPGQTLSFTFDLFAFGCSESFVGFSANTYTGAQVFCQQLNDTCDFSVPAGFFFDDAYIPPPLQIVFSGSFQNVCDSGCNAAVSATVSGGLPPYTFLWSDGDTLNTADSLCAGVHFVTVTDAGGCTVIDSFENVLPPPIFLTDSVNDSLTCFYDSIPYIEIVTGGTPPYIIQLSTGQSAVDTLITGDTILYLYENLFAGTHVFTLTDANGCLATDTFSIISPPPIAIVFFPTGDVVCNGDTSGSVEIDGLNSSFGTPPATFFWSNGDTTFDIFGLSAGIYTVTVIDASTCFGIASDTVNEPPALVLSFNPTTVLCYGDSGTIDLTVGGGVPPYTFLWSNGATTEDISGLSSANVYSVIVTDSNGCTITDTSAIISPPGFVLTLTAIDVLCYGDSTGSIDLTVVAGGVLPYTFLWSNGATTEDIFFLAANTYTVTVTDTNGCTSVAGDTVIQPPQLLLTLNSTGISCFGKNDGSIDLSISGGTPGYTFFWSNAATTEDIDSLGKGTYTVFVADSNSCGANDTVIITEPDLLTLALLATGVTCPGDSDGTAAAAVAGGSTPYTYIWSNGATTSSISNLQSAIYHITVTDSHNCTAIDSAQINAPPFPNSSFSLVQTGSICMGDSVIFVNNSTPASGVNYLWDFGDGAGAAVQNPTHAYAAPGIFQVVLRVNDSCGRFHSSAQVLNIIPSDSTYNVNCCSENTFYHRDGNIIIASANDAAAFIAFLAVNNNNIKMRGDLLIDAGQTLSLINGQHIQFHLNSKVLVKRSATLELDNGTLLTGLDSCNTMWQGVEVWGRADKTHSASDQQFHGKLIVKNASVTRAHLGVLLGKREPKCFPAPPQYCPNPPCPLPVVCKNIPVNVAFAGGILLTSNNANFNTNGVDIRFTPYIYNNVSSIQNTNFTGGILPDPGYIAGNSYTYPGNNSFFGSANNTGRTSKGLWQWGVKGVTIKNNNFGNIEAAMESFDSKYNVTACSFKKHEYGIRIYNTNSTIDNRHTIDSCFFNEINAMILIDGGRFDVVKRDTFGNILTSQQINVNAVILTNTSNYRVVNNQFNRLNTGLFSLNSGMGGGYVGFEDFENSFTRCATGISTFGQNKLLKLKCNDHRNPQPLDYGGNNWFNYGTLATQGSFHPILALRHKFAAGNKFFQLPRKQLFAFNFSGINSVYEYFHHSDTTLMRPTPAGALLDANLHNVGVPSQGSSCTPFDPCNVGPIFCSPFTDSIPIWLAALQAEYDSILSILDKGNTVALLAAIAKAPPLSPGQLKALLLANSPLSDAVLLALCRRTPSLSFGTFKEVIIPNSPVSPSVRPVLDSLMQTWGNQAGGAKKEIIAAQAGNPGYRTLTAIEREMEFLKTWRQENISNFINSLVQSGSDSLRQIAIDFLENENTVESNLMLFSVYLSDSNLIAAAAKLAQLPDTTVHLQQWKTVSGILLSLSMQGNTVFEMDSAQEQSIRQIAGTAMVADGQGTMGLGASNAQAILRLVFGEEFPLILALPSAKTAKTDTKINAEPLRPSPMESGEDAIPNYLGDNIPNPFSNTTLIPYYVPDGREGILMLFGKQGRVIGEYPLQSGKGVFEISLNHLGREIQYFATGVYLYSLYIDGKHIQTKKMLWTK